MTAQRIGDDPTAPFGFDEDGSAIAPYGLKADGTPRLSNRGRTAGSGFGGAGPSGAKRKTARTPRKKTVRPTSSSGPRPPKAAAATDYRAVGVDAVAGLSIVPALLAANPAGLVTRLLGPSAPLAMKGNAYILGVMAEPVGVALGQVAEINPAVARVMDRMTGSMPMPYLALVQAVTQLAGALVDNTRRPSEKLAQQADHMFAMQAEQMRRRMEEQRQADAPPAPEPDEDDGQEDEAPTARLMEFAS